MAKAKKPIRKETNIFLKYLGFIIVLLSSLFLALIYYIDILPMEYFYVLVGIFLSTNVLLIWGLHSKNTIGILLFTIISIAASISLVVGVVYEINTVDFLKKIGYENYQTLEYKVYVLKDSSYESLDDLKEKEFGSINDTPKEVTNNIINNTSGKINDYSDITSLSKSLFNKENDAIILESSYESILNDEDGNFSNNVRVVYSFTIDKIEKDTKKEKNITTEPFNVYISGIDTYGSINSVSRSDVNILVTINPQTKKILLTSIPRDYYVSLYEKNAKDKLTHAGIYGIDTSIGTIENLLDTKINYYVKVNFSSVLNIIKELGTIEVYSAYSFTSMDGYTYKKGYNTLNNKETLSFVRERKAFQDGDRVRGENQEAVIEAIIKKLTATTILTNYNSFLNSIDGSFKTNLSKNDITSFIKMQIDENIDWQIEKILLDGSDSFNYTYSIKNAKSYVMEPNQESINNAKSLINKYIIETNS